MQYKINADPKRIIGKRPNLAAQNSVVDEVVTAFSAQQEQPPVPLSSTASAKSPTSGKVLAIVGAALSFAPFLIAIVLMILAYVQGYTLYLVYFPIYVLAFRNYSLFGGLALYLAARKVNRLRKPIGWIALANLLVIIPFFLYAIEYSKDPTAAALFTGGVKIMNTISSVASALCMIALSVFAVMLLVRAFKKETKPAPVESN